MAEWIFYGSMGLIFYTYVGYPIVLFFLQFLLKNDTIRDDINPTVTVIIPAHNEERTIGTKVDNCLSSDYPANKTEIVVISDFSTDKTCVIVKGFKDERVSLLELPFRGGKVAAQNYALGYCNSEIIIFTDAAILTRFDAIRMIVQNFADPKVGVVSSRDAIIGGKDNIRGEGRYIEYDMMVRKYTSRIGSLIGVTGGFYAVRRSVARGGWNPAFPPDFYIALRCIKKGLKVIEDPRVIAYYKTAKKEWDELSRKVRTMNRGMNALFGISNRRLLNPMKYGVISLELISHKILRWLTPLFLFGMLVSSLLLSNDSIIGAISFVVQSCIYLLSFVIFLNKESMKKGKIGELVFYFSIANLAIIKAWYEFIKNRKYVMWQPTRR